MRLIGLTKDDEINCEQCLSLVAEFAEQQLAGKSIPEGLKAVEHHLSICAECREEYEALQRVLQDLED
jgi:predicted anti-sigma-YlaC factor YlaD